MELDPDRVHVTNSYYLFIDILHFKDFEDLFELLEKSLTRLANVDKLLFKHSERITQLLNTFNKLKSDMSGEKINALIECSQLYLNFLNEHEILSENFIYYAYKLYLRFVAIKNTKIKNSSNSSKKK